MTPVDPTDPRNSREPLESTEEVRMNPYLEELLASANTDHVLQGGTGEFDALQQKLLESLLVPANAPFAPHIAAALEKLELSKLIAPVQVKTRDELRTFFKGALGEELLDPRGPMELEE